MVKNVDQVDITQVDTIASGRDVNYKVKYTSGVKMSQGAYDDKGRHISEQPFTWANWHQHINWLNFILVIALPLSSFAAAPFVSFNLKTAAFAMAYYICTGLGITAGYHRLWAHRAYKAALPVRFLLAVFGGGAVEGSIRWWASSHRVHHRWTDSNKDPYDARKGFWFSHFGWMLLVPNPKNKGRTDISDLNNDWVVRLQHKYYVWILLFMAIVLPTLVCGLGWGDWKGGFVYAGVMRYTFVQQVTFCVNSLAHWIGEQPFDDRRTPRDHALTALVTFGEGYHNFHHEFPSDYRNALIWYQYDPTKWLIWTLKQVGLAWDLQTFSQNAIEQGLVQQRQKKLDKWRNNLNWGIPIEQLPVIEFEEFREQAKTRDLVLISGIVHDVSGFVENHPGGKALIMSAVGKDGTAVFNGGVYRHSNAAHNLLATMRVSVIRGGMEVEVWKTAQNEKKDQNIVTDESGNRIHRAGLQATRVENPGMSGMAA